MVASLSFAELDTAQPQLVNDIVIVVYNLGFLALHFPIRLSQFVFILRTIVFEVETCLLGLPRTFSIVKRSLKVPFYMVKTHQDVHPY